MDRFAVVAIDSLGCQYLVVNSRAADPSRQWHSSAIIRSLKCACAKKSDSCIFLERDWFCVMPFLKFRGKLFQASCSAIFISVYDLSLLTCMVYSYILLGDNLSSHGRATGSHLWVRLPFYQNAWYNMLTLIVGSCALALVSQGFLRLDSSPAQDLVSGINKTHIKDTKSCRHLVLSLAS